ncbi:alpha/beta hydrolase [Pseudoduganella buxea]|uniref:Alpha/beta hydrolase n=1 Tax=Pseudoduganella buxea TaxID=1949069 RepID=A0A6I3SSC6_9BURK|nr:alpha/beta hydrolase [Pseudoduganella buxea]MTV51974.1 alpha/beta hydrolase [Pseudoduganella buxea]GGB97668.1 alpha/beta hydrolase [Pseudoduganella buxea]
MNTSKKVVVTVGVASFLWASLVSMIAASQRKLLFNPTLIREVQSPRSAGHRTRAVVLRAKDGTRLAGWLMTPNLPGPHPAVVYFGGRSEEVSWVARDAGTLFPGMAVLAVNYRGYGDSRGVPGEEHMIEDGCMLFDWLCGRSNVDKARVAVVGRSLGSGVAVQVAKERPAHSVVLITPYDSILALAQRKFRVVPVSFVLKHRFESVKYASLLSAPTYIVRAASDDVVPHSHTDLLVAQMTRVHQDEIIPDSDHMNIPYLPATQQKIAQFLTTQFAVTRPLPETAPSAA